MESLFILSMILFFAVAIYRKFLSPIFKGDRQGNADDEESYTYERPKTNPATGYRMFNKSGVDTGGNFYGQFPSNP